ncbi:MAG: DUF3365 domain-containing protein [Proteobacteria bacterium]|nr:DUF3365 domain-containing protein [Pseudomonadota bacterium]MBU1583124.1 DUF3365 domain-containing protein [Pseudomonadota bacterium]MBU2630881.1 DUF3365 domain-containing protein [Pseudomonadota bacterium]
MNFFLNSINTKNLFCLLNATFFSLLVTIFGFVIAFNIKQHALDEAQTKAEMIADQYFAIHTYFSQELNPSALKTTQAYRSNDYFDPIWMPSTYAVKQIQKTILSKGKNDYSIKNAAINARNPDNEADPNERQFILQLNKDPDLMEESFIQMINNEPFLVLLTRGESFEKSCLNCHGSPGQAPKELLLIYGNIAGFNRTIGDCSHVITIKTPLPKQYSKANSFALKLSVLFSIIVFCFFYGQYLLVNYILFKPISVLQSTIQKISNDPEKLQQIDPLPPGKELNQLVKTFNLMSQELHRNMEEIETLSRKRALELSALKNELRSKTDQSNRYETFFKDCEKRYETLFNSISDSVLIFDARTRRFINCNKSALNLYGYAKEKFLQLHLNDITEEYELSETPNPTVLDSKKNNMLIQYHKKKDGTVFPVEISSGIFKIDNHEMEFSIVRDVTGERKNEAKILRNEDRLRLLTRQLIKTREDECKRISLELHDSMGQSLTAAGFNLSLLGNDIPDACQELLADTVLIVNNLADQVRELSLDLRPNMLDDLGLIPTLRWYLNKFTKRTKIKTTLKAVELDKYKNENFEITIFRVVQESLNNVQKHAKARHVEISLRREGTRVTGSVQDDGKGFDINKMFKTSDRKHMGMLSMKERISILGGRLKIQSDKGQGTRISFEIPFERLL